MAPNAEASSSAIGAATLISADQVRGTVVHGRDGDKLGTVDRLILDKGTGQVVYVILSSGRFLGLGGSYHPIPWSAFRYDDKLDRYTVAIDKRVLEGAPAYGPDSAPLFDEAYGQRVTEYYRLSLKGV